MTTVRPRTLLLVLATLAAFLGLTALDAPSEAAATRDAPSPAGSSAQQQLEATARAATARYHDVEVAIADGYEPVSPCTEAPGLGAMGVHYLNHGLIDDVIDAGEPELLLYLPTEDGMRLVGVEYMRVAADQDPSDGLDASDGPSLGGVPFDGPMAGHAEGEPFHYDLHVWVWAHNPAGTYAQWNPALHCPTAAADAHQH